MRRPQADLFETVSPVELRINPDGTVYCSALPPQWSVVAEVNDEGAIVAADLRDEHGRMIAAARRDTSDPAPPQ